MVKNRLTNEEVLERVIYRDGMILALNKPTGIAVHKANGGHYNIEQYFHLLQFGLPKPPSLAHRLDFGTSGCLVLARHAEAARRLQLLFSNSIIKKTYLAVVQGLISAEEGRIDFRLSKKSSSKKHWWMKVDSKGQEAITDFKVLARLHDKTLVQLSPITGRTHQLRVHCAALGHPIIGDYIYGSKDGADLHLHAHRIVMPLYPKKSPLIITAPLPAHMMEAEVIYSQALGKIQLAS